MVDPNYFQLKNRKGAALVTALLIMIVLSLMGAAAIFLSSLDIESSRQDRIKKSAFYSADAGVELAPSIIDYFIQTTPDPGGFPGNLRGDLQGIVDDPNFLSEIMGYTTDNDGATDSPQSNPDIHMALAGREIDMDIDRFRTEHAGGGSAESLAGYEGIGAGGSTGGTAVYYRARSRGRDPVNVRPGEVRNTVSEVEIVYRYIY